MITAFIDPKEMVHNVRMERDSARDMLAASLIDPLAVPAVFMDKQGTILRHNTAWINWIAQNPEPIFGPTVTNLIHPDEIDKFATFLSVASRDCDEGAIYRTTHSRRSFWISAVCGNAKWNSGFLGMLTPSPSAEIQLEKAQHSLADLETLRDRWRYAMNNDLHGLWDINLVTNDRYFSKGWRRIRGLPDNAKGNQTFEDLLERIHPQDRDGVKCRMTQLDTGVSNTFCDEFREMHANGHWVWILSQGEVLARQDCGRPARIIGTDTDISHLKELGGQFVDLSQRLELALTASGIGVWEYNIERKSAEWDQRMYDIYGIDDPDTCKGRDVWREMLHPEDRDEMLMLSDRAAAEQSNFDLSYRIIRPSGEVRHIRSTGHHYIDAQGLPKLIGLNWDTTESEQQAQALRDAHARAERQNADLEQARAEMEHLSRHDALTDLPNRRMLEIYCDDAQRRLRGTSMRSAVLHVDLDRFKQINDTLGHAAGDAVLRHVANILKDAATPNSIVARVGGDEFVIFVDHVPHDAMLSQWANYIIKQAKHPFTYQGHECRYGVSIGIATRDKADLSDAALFSNADLALYQAKAEGRGRLRFYSPDLKSAAMAKRQYADDILIALDDHQFKCVYQPQFDCYTHEIIGVEALVRWDHPTRGRLAPDAFLDIAEELDIVAKIDQAVFETSLRDSRVWRASGKYAPQISVNVSAKRLLDPLLSARIAHLADEDQNFSFELLESVFLDDPDDNLSKNLACIRNLGVTIEVDDFGTGHASMVGLLNLRPDRLKVDRQLIMPLVRSQQQRRLVASIIEIGHVLGIAVVAEGVETKEHASVLASLGCDYLQGYGLARPMDATELVKCLPDL